MRSAGLRYIAVMAVLCISCATKGPGKQDEDKGPVEGEVLTIFLTGNELGSMKPCGCWGGQLGGLSRRAAVLKSAANVERLIIDTGGLVAGQSTQDLIKFNVILQAYRLLGYDLVNLTGEDLATAQNLGLAGNWGPDLGIITAPGALDVNLPGRFTRRMKLGGETVAVTVASFNARSGRIEQAAGLFGRASDVQTANILIVNDCGPDVVDSIVREARFADCVICSDGSDRPGVMGDRDSRPLVVSVGRLGKYVGKLEIRADKAEGRLKFTFSAEAVSAGLDPNEALVRLYESYQQILKESRLLETQPRISVSGGLEYMGSESCKDCHKYAYDKWSKQRHARAYATLEKDGSDYDPECVVCHVVGMRYESGFVGPESTAKLKDVGCENCHGPGSGHILSAGEEAMGEPKSDCVDCHTPDNSGHYLSNEAEYFEKNVHWREPNAVGNVKRIKTTGGSKD